ncbi:MULTISPECIES: hypothetical protein [unclassified Microcoleus]
MNNLQLPQKDMDKEIASLQSFIKSDIDARELKRAIADPIRVRASQLGLT